MPKVGEKQVEGTKRFFHELNRLGLTGVVDPGGNNLTPDDYQALFSDLAAAGKRPSSSMTVTSRPSARRPSTTLRAKIYPPVS